jgi:tetratricopeptide (TPR) repeat protein
MEQREVRVFVSSTFRDMSAERDELVKRVFIHLRRLCEQRGVTWGEVDLRWGITDEQKAEGQVLPICLEEIRRCRPYFVGLLGERYGWVPDDLPGDLAAKEPWLAGHRSASVTELEILHGVLNDPAMKTHAFFYLRDPAWVDAMPEDRQAVFREVAEPDDIARFGLEEARRRCDERRAKLEDLKRRIRSSGFPVREGFRSAEDLGRLVLDDLTAVIEARFPERAIPNPLDREAAGHEAFAATRRGVYIGRRAYLDALDRHVGGGGPPLVLLGASGSGKSALLANWAERHAAAHPDELLVMHFVGATPDSADLLSMLRRLIGEVYRRFRIDRAIPTQAADLRAAFQDALGLVPRHHRVVLVLDGLNQLEDRDQAADLAWLPATIPANVRMLLSALPGRALDSLTARGWTTLRIEDLTADERHQVIDACLAQYTKSLSADLAGLIAGAPQSGNPLFLRVLLDELRLHGDHFTVGAVIARCLAAETVDGLYRQVLARYEHDYERERPGLVREAMSLVWAARHGIAEAELLDLLGDGDRPLPRACWSPLFLAAEPALVNRSGLISFSHDFLRRAVAAMYLGAPGAERDVRMRLADYFEGRDLSPRLVGEAPWQLSRAGAWRRLFVWLSDPRSLTALWRENRFDALTYWAQVEDRSALRLVDAYRPVSREASSYPAERLGVVRDLFRETGHAAEALALTRRLVDSRREAGDRGGLAAGLGHLASQLLAGGDTTGALHALEEQERICRETGDRRALAGCLSVRAIQLFAVGDNARALALMREQSRICRELGDLDGLQHALGNEAVLLKGTGDFARALTLLNEKIRICRELGSQDGLARALGTQALILKEQGRLDDAMALRKEEERICRELGHPERIAECLGYQALILRAGGEFTAARALHEEEARICRRLGFTEGLVRSLANLALLLSDDLNRPQEALPLVEEAHALITATGLTALAGRVTASRDQVRARANAGWRSRLFGPRSGKP